MSSRPTPRLSGGRKAIFYAVLVHLALVAVIAIGFRWQVKPAEAKAKAEQERGEAKAKAEQEARAQSELARIEGLIRQKVERNWVRPAGWTKGLECIVRVRLAPTGEVINAAVARTSGNPAFDRSVENAVYKASPLPLSEDKSLFEHFRELELRFRPEGQG